VTDEQDMISFAIEQISAPLLEMIEKHGMVSGLVISLQNSKGKLGCLDEAIAWNQMAYNKSGVNSRVVGYDRLYRELN
jgi:hypothetical protein